MSNKDTLNGRELMAAKSLAFYAGEYSEEADIPHLYCFMAKAMVAHGRLITRTDTLHAKWEAEAQVKELTEEVKRLESELIKEKVARAMEVLADRLTAIEQPEEKPAVRRKLTIPEQAERDLEALIDKYGYTSVASAFNRA